MSALTLCAELPSYAWTWYSGASVGSDGTVYGWGVTDVTAFPMYHVAYVSTTLTSPVKKRQAASGWRSAQNSVRADVSLPFDPNDLGTYEDDSENEGYCYTSMGWFLIEWTEASAIECGFNINGAPGNATCDGITKNETTFQATNIPSACQVYRGGSSASFTTDNIKVTPDFPDSSQDWQTVPMLYAYYWVTSNGGWIQPSFTISFNGGQQGWKRTVTRNVPCK